MLRKRHVADHFRIEKAYGIAGDKIAEPGIKLLCHGCATHDVASFNHRHLVPCATKIKGASQTIVAAADNYNPLLRAFRLQRL